MRLALLILGAIALAQASVEATASVEIIHEAAGFQADGGLLSPAQVEDDGTAVYE